MIEMSGVAYRSSRAVILKGFNSIRNMRKFKRPSTSARVVRIAADVRTIEITGYYAGNTEEP